MGVRTTCLDSARPSEIGMQGDNVVSYGMLGISRGRAALSFAALMVAVRGVSYKMAWEDDINLWLNAESRPLLCTP